MFESNFNTSRFTVFIFLLLTGATFIGPPIQRAKEKSCFCYMTLNWQSHVKQLARWQGFLIISLINSQSRTEQLVWLSLSWGWTPAKWQQSGVWPAVSSPVTLICFTWIPPSSSSAFLLPWHQININLKPDVFWHHRCLELNVFYLNCMFLSSSPPSALGGVYILVFDVEMLGFTAVLIIGWLVYTRCSVPLLVFRVRVRRVTGTFSCRAADVEAGCHRAALAGFGPVCRPSACSGCRGCWDQRHSPASAHNLICKWAKLCLIFLSSGNVVLENLKVKEEALVSR